MWELDHKEGWVTKNWCFWILVLEETLESPLDSKEIKPVHSKGNKPWIFIGRTEAPRLGPPDACSLNKTLMLGKIEGRRKRGWQRIRWFNGIIYSMDMNLNKLREIVEDSKAWYTAVCGVTKSRTKLSNRRATAKSAPRWYLECCLCKVWEREYDDWKSLHESGKGIQEGQRCGIKTPAGWAGDL